MFGWLWLRLSSRRETSGCSFIDFIFYLISSGVTLFPCSSSSQGCYGLLMFNRAEHVNVSDTRKRETNNTHNFAQHSSFLSPSSSSYFWYTVHFVNRRTTDRDFPSKGTSFLFRTFSFLKVKVSFVAQWHLCTIWCLHCCVLEIKEPSFRVYCSSWNCVCNFDLLRQGSLSSLSSLHAIPSSSFCWSSYANNGYHQIREENDTETSLNDVCLHWSIFSLKCCLSWSSLHSRFFFLISWCLYS